MRPIRCEFLITEEIKVRSVLSKTGIPGRTYCINPYVGCAHACRYCYATFMKRFTAHEEPWGGFVDVKTNAPEVLRTQMKRAQRGNVIISSVTDPYQPAERKYNITRKCLEVLTAYNFPVDILTKSPLVLRDIDIISRLKNAEVGMTITTDDERIRRIFEPMAPPITARINALRKFHSSGIKTYVFIGPVLPMNPEALAGKIKPYVSSLIIDRMNYITKVKWLYKKYDLEKWLDEGFIDEIIARLRKSFVGKDVEVC
ncbi:MAG: radical SAM protein [Candidatus Mariimomonas ferrooxydans]